MSDQDDPEEKTERMEEGEKQAGSSRSPAKRVMKRKAEAISEESVSPSKRRKPDCKFGASCYQTNPKHKRDFNHPPVSLCLLLNNNRKIAYVQPMVT